MSASLALRWLFASFLPAVLTAYLVWRTDQRREPWFPSVGTFALGVLVGVPAYFIQYKAAAWTGLDVSNSVAGNAGSLVFQFGLVSPMREAAKVAASWPAFRSRHFDEPYDGLVYAALASMGFAVCDGAWHLWRHAGGGTGIWIVRVLLALPAHLFFASLWGYALGRAKQVKRPGRLFPVTWLAATIGHAFYAHFVYGRGSGALVAASAGCSLAMALVAGLIARDFQHAGGEQFGLPDAGFDRRSMGAPVGAAALGAAARAIARRACARCGRRSAAPTGRSCSAGSRSALSSRSGR